MSPETLTAAFLITQFFLIFITFFGLLVLSYGEGYPAIYDHGGRVTRFITVLLGFALVTLACLAFSEEFVQIWKPVLADITVPSLARNDAFVIVFLLNIVGIGILIRSTGGSKDSPFVAILFALPTLSIFLREDPTRFLSYTALTAMIFFLSLDPGRSGRYTLENTKLKLSYQVVTLSCLALSTLVGYVMRPSSGL